MEKLTFTIQSNKESESVTDHIIIAQLNGEDVGYLRFEERTNFDLSHIDFGNDNVLPKVIYIAFLRVKDEYKGQGASHELYKEFGKWYKNDFMGFPVLHLFTNPVADYAYRKNVSNGNIPVNAFNLEYFYKDDLQDHYGALWRELRVKLPFEYQGNENDWDWEEEV